MFGYSTGGLVSFLSPVYGGSDDTINIPTFFLRNETGCLEIKYKDAEKYPVNLFIYIEQVIGLARTLKIITVALNRTETNLANDSCLVVVQF